VAIGIALDVTYAYLAGMLPLSDWQRILSLLASRCRGQPGYRRRMRFCGLKFREHLGGTVDYFVKGCRPVEIIK
jgi:hypothetical protein